METRVTRLEVLVEHYDKRFDQVEKRFEQVDRQFSEMRHELREERKSLRLNIWLAAITTLIGMWSLVIAVQSMTLDAIQAGRASADKPAAPIIIQLPQQAAPQAMPDATK